MRLQDRLSSAVANGASFGLLLLVALVFVSVTKRYIFGSAISDQFDLSRLILGVVVFWGIAAACANDEYVRGDLIWERLPHAARRMVDAFGRLVILCALGVMVWQVGFKVMDVKQAQEQTSELRLLIWPFYAVMVVGMIAAFVAAVLRFLNVFSRTERPKNDGFAAAMFSKARND